VGEGVLLAINRQLVTWLNRNSFAVRAPTSQAFFSPHPGNSC